MEKNIECAYIVVWSMFSQDSHTLDSELFDDKDKCKEFFLKKYNQYLDIIKKRELKIIDGYESMKNKKPLPKEGIYALVFDIFENEKNISVISDGRTEVDFKINYYCKIIL